MPLVGEAKRAYERVYKRELRRKAREAGKLISAALANGKKRQLAVASRSVVEDVGKSVLSMTLERNGLTADRLVQKNVELLDAARLATVAGEATTIPDNDVRARAVEIGRSWLQLAGLVPTPGVDGHTTSSGARVRMVQIDPDGTERVLEIG